MRKFTRRRGTITSQLSRYEVTMLTSLVRQLVELMTDGLGESTPEPAEAGDDPFDRWARELQLHPDEPEVPEDPVLQRLFPNPYPHDPEAASDYRRFTQSDLRDARVVAARQVLADLAATDDGARPVRVGDEAVDAWLKTLTALRLSLASRLGISDEDSAAELSELPDRDPRAYLYSVYEWLGFAQETLLGCL